MSAQQKAQRKATHITDIPVEPIDRSQYAYTTRLRQAARARRLRKLFVETGCDCWMRYEDFRQQGVRNKIRRSYGLEAIILPHERAPQAAGNEAKPRRSMRKRQRRR